MDRDKIIDYFVKEVEDWDLETLIEFACSTERDRLGKLTDKELEQMWKKEQEY